MTEKYYAVRIGKSPKDFPYLMIRKAKRVTPHTPMIFATKELAEPFVKGKPERKVVPVKIKFSGR